MRDGVVRCVASEETDLERETKDLRERMSELLYQTGKL